MRIGPLIELDIDAVGFLAIDDREAVLHGLAVLDDLELHRFAQSTRRGDQRDLVDGLVFLERRVDRRGVVKVARPGSRSRWCRRC